MFCFKISRIVNSDKKKFFYEASDIPKTWDLSKNHQQDLADIFNETSTIENEVVSNIIKEESDKSMNILSCQKNYAKIIVGIKDICGSCYALLENHIEYTNKLLRWRYY